MVEEGADSKGEEDAERSGSFSNAAAAVVSPSADAVAAARRRGGRRRRRAARPPSAVEENVVLQSHRRRRLRPRRSGGNAGFFAGSDGVFAALSLSSLGRRVLTQDQTVRRFDNFPPPDPAVGDEPSRSGLARVGRRGDRVARRGGKQGRRERSRGRRGSADIVAVGFAAGASQRNHLVPRLSAAAVASAPALHGKGPELFVSFVDGAFL